MLNINYAKLMGEYPEYLRLPVELKAPLIINGVTHPIGGAAPAIGANKTYEFDVYNGVWAVQEVVSA